MKDSLPGFSKKVPDFQLCGLVAQGSFEIKRWVQLVYSCANSMQSHVKILLVKATRGSGYEQQ